MARAVAPPLLLSTLQRGLLQEVVESAWSVMGRASKLKHPLQINNFFCVGTMIYLQRIVLGIGRIVAYVVIPVST